MTDSEKHPGCVYFINCFAWSKKKIPLELEYDVIDKWFWNKIPFNEVLGFDIFYHLYFDFDSISSVEEFDDVKKWLDSLTDIFGPYSIGGYTKSQELEVKTGLKRIEDADHFCSIHVIFYTTKIKGTEIQEIMKYKSGFEYNVHRLCDPNVYKLGTRQIFRHALSNKIYGPGDERNKMIAGCLMDKKTPSQHIVQIRGFEKEIPREEWSKVFKKIEQPKKEKTKKIVDDWSREDIDPEDFEIKTDLINMTPEELHELMIEFEPTFPNFEKIMVNLFHSPFDQEYMTFMVKNWYFARNDHHNLTTIDDYSEKYYEKVDSNKWFFSILNHLDATKKRYYLEKYANNHIDESIEVDLQDQFSLFDIRKKDYQNKNGIRVGEFLSDLKKVLIVVDCAKSLYFIKDIDIDEKTMKFSPLDDAGFKLKMTSINLGYYFEAKKKKTINAYQIFCAGKNKNFFMRRQIKFYSDNPEFFSIFYGYQYSPLKEIEMPIIQPFLNHIHDIIADNNDELYEYILNWVSYIIQNINGKTETALVLTGKEGTGKNTFTDSICHLLKGYSEDNINKIDQIVGSYNSLLENKKLIICNELSSADNNQFIDFDTLKSVITEKTIIISEKYQPSRPAENVVNLIFLSNHDCPVRLYQGDRRYVVSETSSARKDDFAYFKALNELFRNEKFYPNLFTYFWTRDISQWNSRILPQTAARTRLIDNSKSAYELFIEENLDDFKAGISKDESYLYFKTFAKNYGFKECNISTYKTKMTSFCKEIRIRLGGQKVRAFRIRDDKLEKFENDRDEVSDEDEPAELLPPDLLKTQKEPIPKISLDAEVIIEEEEEEID